MRSRYLAPTLDSALGDALSDEFGTTARREVLVSTGLVLLYGEEAHIGASVGNDEEKTWAKRK